MMHIIVGSMQLEDEGPDGHGATSRWHLPKSSTDGGPDRHGCGINGTVEEANRHSKMSRSQTAPPKGSLGKRNQ